MLSFALHTSIGEQDLLLPRTATSSFTTVAGQGWLAGRIALSGCTAAFNRLMFVDQGTRERLLRLPEGCIRNSGEPRQKWRISPRVGMTNDASAANGRAPSRHLDLASAAPVRPTPFHSAVAIAARNIRATAWGIPGEGEPRASHRVAFGMPGRAGKARSAVVVGSRLLISQGGREPLPADVDWRRGMQSGERRRNMTVADTRVAQ